MAMEKPRRISDQHWKFIRAYILTGDKPTAMQHAGYETKDLHTAIVNANRLLRREDVQWAMQQFARDQASEIPEDGPIRLMAMEHAEPADLGRLGSREGRAEFLSRMARESEDDKVRLRALQLLGMMFGDYTQRGVRPDEQESQASNSVTINISSEDAKAVIRGQKMMKEVIDVQEVTERPDE